MTAHPIESGHPAADSSAIVPDVDLASAAPVTERRRDAGTGPAFARGLWRIAAADVSSGNQVELLHDGPATFDAMCDLVDHAQETVVLEAYIFRPDETGKRIAEALIRACGRGVSVRLLTDWIGM